MLRSCKVVSNDNLVTGNNIAVTNLLLVSLVFPSFFFTLLATLKSIVIMKYSDQYQYLGNCPPTPPLTQQQSIDNKFRLMLGQGRGRWAVAQILILIQILLTLPYIMYHFSTENLDLNSSVSLNSCITNSFFLLPFYLKTNGFCEGKTLFALFRK